MKFIYYGLEEHSSKILNLLLTFRENMYGKKVFFSLI